MTVGNCADACAEEAYTLAGVEYGGEVSSIVQSRGFGRVPNMRRVRKSDFSSAGVVTLSTLDQHLLLIWKSTATSHVMET